MGMHGYIDNQITSDETILYRARLSWKPVVLRLLLFVLVAVAIGIGSNALGQLNTGLIVAAAIVILGVVLQLPTIFRNLGVDIVVTDKRLHWKHGLIIVKDDREGSLSRIDDTDIDFNTVFERLFDYGSVEVHTIGTEFMKLDKVARPRKLVKAIREAKADYTDPLASEFAAVRPSSAQPETEPDEKRRRRK